MEYVRQNIGDYSSNIVDTYSEWSESSVYYVEQEANGPLTDTSVVLYGKYYYRTIVDGNQGFNPEEYLGIKWVRWGVANSYAISDLQTETRATASNYNNIVVDYVMDSNNKLIVGNATIGVIKVENLGIGSSDYSGSIGDFLVDHRGYYRKVLTTGVGATYEDELMVTPPAEELLNYALDDDLVTYQITSLSPVTLVEADLPVGGVLNLRFTTQFNEDDVEEYVFYRHVLPSGAATPTHVISKISTTSELICEILAEQVIYYGYNTGVTNAYNYIYSPYTLHTDREKVFDVNIALGSSVRVSLLSDLGVEEVACGFMVAGLGEDMGDTLYGVNFSFNSYSVRNTDEFGTLTITKRGVQELVDFETSISSPNLQDTLYKIRDIHDEVVAFILDPSNTSVYNNLVTFGIIESVNTVLANAVLSTVSWSISETI